MPKKRRKATKLFATLIVNRRTGRKALLSDTGETRIFDSKAEALASGEESFGKANPHVECRAVEIGIEC